MKISILEVPRKEKTILGRLGQKILIKIPSYHPAKPKMKLMTIIKNQFHYSAKSKMERSLVIKIPFHPLAMPKVEISLVVLMTLDEGCSRIFFLTWHLKD